MGRFTTWALAIGCVLGLLSAACASPAPAPTPTTTAAQYLADGDRQFREYKWSEAATSYAKAVDQADTKAVALAHLSFLNLFQPGKQKEALEMAKRATAAAPDSAEAFAYYARALDWNHDYAGALTAGQKAVALDDKLALAHAFYAEALADDGQIEPAVAEAKRAAALDANQAEVQHILGYVLAENNQPDDALQALKKAAELAPQVPYYAWELSRAYLSRQDVSNAQKEVQRAAKLDSNSPYTLLAIGNLYTVANQPDQALPPYRQLTTQAPTYAEGYKALAAFYLEQSQLPEAFESVNTALQLDNGDPESYLLRAQVTFLAQESKLALDSLNRAIELAPRRAISAYLLRARINVQNAKLSDARADLDKVIELSSTRPTLKSVGDQARSFRDDLTVPAEELGQRGLSEVQAKQWAKAAQTLTHALALQPASPNALAWRIGRGAALYRTDQLPDALSEFRAILQSQPNNRDAHYYMGEVWLKAGQIEQALNEFQTALLIDANHGPSLNGLGRIHLQQGKYDRAEQEFLTQLKLTPDNPDAYLQLGGVYAAQNKPNEALASLDKAEKLGADDPALNLYRGLAQRAAGQKDEAIKELKLYLQKAPNAGNRQQVEAVIQDLSK